MQKTYDVVAVGDALIDFFLSIQDIEEHCHLNEKDCEFCFKYGDKIPLENYALRLGGTASNIAVGLARLGLSVALMAEIGDDEFSERIIEGLEKEKVDLSFVKKTPRERSSIAISIQFRKERTLFIDHVLKHYDFQFANLATKWLYLSGLGDHWKHVYKEVADFVKSKKCKLAFVPGSYQLAEKGVEFMEILKLVDIIFINKEEAETIVNHESGIMNYEGKLEELLGAVQELGPKKVVVTDGAKGSYVLDQNGKFYQYGVVPTKILQKTGAGDAYASGFLAAILAGKTIAEAMKWGSVNSASVISKIGAQPGLLTREEIEEKVLATSH